MRAPFTLAGATARRAGLPLAAALLLALLLVAGCGEQQPLDEDDPSAILPPGGGPIVYHRDYVFFALEPEQRLTAAFSAHAVVRQGGVAREVGAWILEDDAWRPLVRERWNAPLVRQPWRILPHGELRVLVGDAGEVEALVVRSEGSEVRLSPGPVVDDWTPGPGEARLRTRSALLEGAGETEGLLLEAERTSRQEDRPFGGDHALLVGQQGLSAMIVLGSEGDARQGWLRHRGRTEAVELGLRPGEPGSEGWVVVRDGSEVVGELEPTPSAPAARAAGTAPGDPPDEAAAASPVRLRGWLLAGGERRPVVGILHRAPTQ